MTEVNAVPAQKGQPTIRVRMEPAKFGEVRINSMNRLRYALILASISLSLASCATPTAYQPARSGFGYSEQKIESDRYRVTFAGNSSTPRTTVENYLLFRAAELTLASGYDYFALSDRSTEAETRYQQTVSGFGGFGRYHWGPVTEIGVSTGIPITEYAAEADIVMFKGEKKAGDLQAFDARQVQENLAATIRRPDDKDGRN